MQLVGPSMKGVLVINVYFNRSEEPVALNIQVDKTKLSNNNITTISTFFFNSFPPLKNQNELKTHSAYKTESTFISMAERKENRRALIEIFMKFWNQYKKTRVYNSAMDHYLPVFFRWFKNLGYIQITEDEKINRARFEADRLSDIRTIFSKKPDTAETNTLKKIFIDHFQLAVDNNYPIEDQLKKMKL